MKTFWSGLAKVLLILLVVVAWFLYQQHQEKQELLTLNQQLRTELAIVQKSLKESQLRAEVLEKKSLEGMLRETNKVVVSGWETLLDTVEQELNKARKTIQQKKQQGQQPEEPAGVTNPGSSVENNTTEPSIQPEPEVLNDKPLDIPQEEAAKLIEGERT